MPSKIKDDVVIPQLLDSCSSAQFKSGFSYLSQSRIQGIEGRVREYTSNIPQCYTINTHSQNAES